MIESLTKYEELNTEYYSEANLTQRILTHPSSGDVKERIANSQARWCNTFRHAYIWVKGELLDIKGMNDAIEGRLSIIKKLSEVINKQATDQKDLDDLMAGKTTIKNFFKTKNNKNMGI